MRRADPFDHDVFDGYPDDDMGHAHPTVQALRRARLRVFFDLNLLPGNVSTTVVHDAVEQAVHTEVDARKGRGSDGGPIVLKGLSRLASALAAPSGLRAEF